MRSNWLSNRQNNSSISVDYLTQPTRLLTDLKPNVQARILGFAPSISVDRKAHLQAYGIIPGNILRVQQSRPIMIVQVEHTEIALEFGLAELIYVTSN